MSFNICETDPINPSCFYFVLLQNHSSLIIDLRNAAFGTDSGPKKPGQTNAVEYQKLGFDVLYSF